MPLTLTRRMPRRTRTIAPLESVRTPLTVGQISLRYRSLRCLSVLPTTRLFLLSATSALRLSIGRPTAAPTRRSLFEPAMQLERLEQPSLRPLHVRATRRTSEPHPSGLVTWALEGRERGHS